MGVRSAIVRLLSRGSAPPVDEDELVELLTVPSFDGPLVITELRFGGVEAAAVDSYNVATKLVTDVRIMVRRRDLDAAERIVADRYHHEIE